MSLGRLLGSWVLMELLSQQTPGTRAAPAPHPAQPGSRDSAAHTMGRELLLAAFSVPVCLMGDRAGPALPLCMAPTSPPHRDRHQAPAFTPCPWLRRSLRGGFEYIFYYFIYFSSKFSAKWCFGRSDMVCEVWLNSVKFDLPTEGCSIFNTSSSSAQPSPSKYHFPL